MSKDKSKPSKKQIVTDYLQMGITNPREIFTNAAEEHGEVIHVNYIRQIAREFEMIGRVASGKHKPQEPTKPFAESGLTGNPIANEYLKKSKSSGGGFLRMCVYDIETTSFKADFGYLLTCTFKDVDTGKISVYRLDETDIFKKNQAAYFKGKDSPFKDPNFWDVIDIELLDKVRQHFEDYNLVITYNGRYFDEKFLATRLLGCGLQSINPGIKHMDVYQLVKRSMQLGSMKQDAVKNFLKIDDEPDTHSWAFWRMAAAGLKEGFDFVVDHNIKDVEQLHQIAQRLKDHVKYWFF
jgi:hypothetical protein